MRSIECTLPLLAAFVIHVASGCADDPSGPPPKKREPQKPTLTIVSGDRQKAEVGTVLPQPLVVAFRDSLRAPIAGVMVRFLGGENAADSALTDESGLASVRWTLGGQAAPQSVLAVATVYAGPSLTTTEAVFTATATPGPVARVRVTVVTDLALPDTPVDTVSAVVMDRFANPIAGASVAWNVELGGGSVRGLSDVADAGGVARAIWTMGSSAGDNVLAVTSSAVIGRLTAIATVGFPATRVAVGGAHSCALTRLGTAYCWGSNTVGQVGSGRSDQPQTSPVRVAAGLTFTSLTAGLFHTCGLTPAGEAYCWGGNASGQVGSGGSVAVAPTRVAGALIFTALAAGTHHTCGLTSDASVWCWGDNTAGQLGDGIDRSSPQLAGAIWRASPSPVVGGHSFVALAASAYATCAIATTGDPFCWGGNAQRELGITAGVCRMAAIPYYTGESDWPCSTTPVAVPTPIALKLKSLTAAGGGVCGLTMTRGELVCWGANLSWPMLVPGSLSTAAWSLGNVVCATNENAPVLCWGLFGVPNPTPRPFGDGITLVNLSSTGGGSSCGLTRDEPSVAYCWGSNEVGQLGDGTTDFRRDPVAVGLPRTPR